MPFAILLEKSSLGWQRHEQRAWLLAAKFVGLLIHSRGKLNALQGLVMEVVQTEPFTVAEGQFSDEIFGYLRTVGCGIGGGGVTPNAVLKS